jgi:hypothetical protein
LIASDQLTLGANSKITADGDNSPSGSSGGQIMVQSAQTFSDVSGSQIEARGGANGGDGGRLLVYTDTTQSSVNSSLDVSAPNGSSGSIDYYPIVDGNLTLTADSLSPFAGFSQILFQASGNITFAPGTTWSLYDSTGIAAGQLALEAGNNITFGNGSGIYGAVLNYDGDGNPIFHPDNWSMTLKAGFDFSSGMVQAGVGSIYLNGGAGLKQSSYLQTSSGSITLVAGQDVEVGSVVNGLLAGSGSITTTGGGSISVTALAGSVNTGAGTAGYYFNPSRSGYQMLVNPSLGGISTADGGDVNITAGLDIISYLPAGNSAAADAGSGAFGIGVPGNVTLTAGRNVVGHFVVADGTGTINAGVNAGTTSSDTGFRAGDAEPATVSALALSLIDGSWMVNAAHDINLQEVRNPNGIFNNKGNAAIPTYHHFDYAQDDFVNLNAGNAVQLGGSLPRNSGESSIPSIYPPILNITAGAGGVIIGNEVVLFPSPLGSLNITTTGGGPLETSAYAGYLLALAAYDPGSGNPPPLPPADPVEFIMSDSGSSQYTKAASFGEGDHANVPVHLNSPTLVSLNISGDMDNIYLIVPEAAQINVTGDMNNSRFEGQNLSSDPSQTVQVPVRESNGSLGTATGHPGTTSIEVTGDILNRNEFTTVPVSSLPDLSLLNLAYPSPLSDLFNRLFYDPTTQTLTLQGVLSAEDYKALTSLVVQVYENGIPLVTDNPDGTTTPVTTTVSILNTTTAMALLAESQDVPQTPNTGYALGGGGQFNITARNLDLGATLGIQSIGPAYNPALAYNPMTGAGSTHGAAVNVNLAGNLDMFSTTISSLNGGDISVNAGGYVDAGSTLFTGNNTYARGIFTAGGGNVDVVAGGDIEINGSRIAAFDGGNVTVKSFHGNIDAGKGGSGAVAVEEFYVDPITGQIYSYEPVIPGSGILATTFPPRDSSFPAPGTTVGNILVDAPQGNINASAGGILQLPLNGSDSSGATVNVLAGYDFVNGSPVFASDGRSIDASGSGVIGSTVNLKATGDIKGLVFARNNANVSSQQNAEVTVLAEGIATVSAGGNVSGTIIGMGGISASGSSVDASLLSQNISTSGNVTSSQVGFAQGTAANSASQGLANNASTQAAAAASDPGADDPNKKKGREIVLAQKVSRVTVILPPKKVSETRNANPGT